MARGAGPLGLKEALRMPDFAGAAATAARLRLGARLGAAAGAGLARHRCWDADLRGFAGESLVEADFHVVAQVRTAFAARFPSARPAHPLNAFQDAGERRTKIGAKPMRPAA